MQQDNDPELSRSTEELSEKNRIIVLERPSQSPQSFCMQTSRKC